jgi:hypothetical protein
MPLNLNDLMKKAKDRGITTSLHANSHPSQLIRPWQQESVLFETTKKIETSEQQPDRSIKNQTDNKPTTNRQHNEVTANEIDGKKKEQLTTLTTTNRQQTGNITTKVPFSSLVGLQRAIIIFIYNECKIARSKTTESLTLEHLSMALKASCGCIKTTIQRLEAKGVVGRVEFKNGRGGWSKYTIPDLLFQELLQYESNNKLVTNWKQTDNSLVYQPTKQPTTSSGSNISINTITTLPEDLKQIDCSPLAEIGFNESHIIQIHREYIQKPELVLSAEIIQNSIHALAFDLKHNSVVFRQPPAVLLVSVLKKGKPYSSVTPEKCLTPREEAMQEYLLAQEKRNLKILEIESKTKEFSLQEWLSTLSEEEILNFNSQNNVCPPGVPERIFQISRKKKALSCAKDYFDTIIWPQKRKQILNNEENALKLEQSCDL